MDASHLTLTALRMQKLGHSFVGIHDSFGTHPSAVDDLHRSIREAFVELYADKSILAQFMLDNSIEGSAPMTGELDLTRVLGSEFFFC
jgi:DNA-directed RNA polymerase, mitochondrial